MDEILTRIKQLMTSRGQTANAFAIQADINSSNFAKKIKGAMKITKADIDKICGNLGVNADWLVNGNGEVYTMNGKAMLKNQFAIKLVKSLSDKEKERRTPFYDIDFALGFNEMYNDEPNVPSKYISVPGYEKADFWCRTSGDSMKPFISNGDIIALKEVFDWQNFLPMNEVYAVMTTNNLRTIKVVRRGSDEMHFTLHAYNEEYEDQEINKAAITKVFKVLGALKTV